MTVDILSKYDGIITKFHAKEGDTVAVGAPLIDIDTEAKAGSTPAAAAKSEAAPPKVS